MLVTVEDGRVVAERSDGVAVTWALVDPTAPLPHDLGHFGVESTLGIDDGFWGLVARGAMFAGMSRLDGGGTVAAARRRVKRHADALVEIERTVAAVVGWWKGPYEPVPTGGFSADDVARCYPALDLLRRRYATDTPLTLTWND